MYILWLWVTDSIPDTEWPGIAAAACSSGHDGVGKAKQDVESTGQGLAGQRILGSRTIILYIHIANVGSK